ncbi:MAG: hypothetical protein HY744_23075 [Deltaproteobacteria bacterium]|nr:hypothetical protein [Deltaproteobacteria bacterium]
MREDVPQSRLLLALGFASGVCGLAYEVLYSRLLTTYLGDMVQVSAAILAAFLAGLGVGSLVAYRWYRFLWLIEVLIGACGLLVALVLSLLSPATLLALLPLGAGNELGLVACAMAVVAAPSLLIGCSVPLFSAYLEAQPDEAGTRDGFARIYAVYNLGAGLCVLALQFWLLRRLGLRGSIVAVALVNLATGLGLRRFVPAPARPRRAPAPAAAPPAARAALVALFVASALSACYQMLALQLVGAVFGPFHENFALLLALVMLGLGLGAAIVRRVRIGLGAWLAHGGIVLVASSALFGDLARLWAWLSGAFVDLGPLRSAVKASVMLAMTLPAFTVFGGTVPALLRERPAGGKEPGRTLAVSSFGNCCGFLLSVLLLLQHVPRLGLVALCSVGTAVLGALLLPAGRWRRPVWAVLAAGALFLPLGSRWPEELLALARAGTCEPALAPAAGPGRGRAPQRRDHQASRRRARDRADALGRRVREHRRLHQRLRGAARPDQPPRAHRGDGAGALPPRAPPRARARHRHGRDCRRGGTALRPHYGGGAEPGGIRRPAPLCRAQLRAGPPAGRHAAPRRRPARAGTLARAL